MKTLAIMGSGNGSNFEAIVKYFRGKYKGKCPDKDIEITCLSDFEGAYILERAKNLGIKSKYLPFEDNREYFKENKFDLIVLAGYMKILPDDVLAEMGNVINIHPSLLPAFKGSRNAIKDAFLAGVKVSGVTVHWVTSDIDGGQIIAQYPVFITNDMHLDELEDEIHKVEHKLYPIVIEKLLEDKIFDFSDLMKTNCGSNCGCCHNKNA